MLKHLFFFPTFLILSLILSCAPKKQEIDAYDLKRVLERFAQNRIQTGLMADSKRPTPTDMALFEEACEVYRLSIPEAKEMLKKENKALYESIYGNE
ncbi:hypothetical protein ND861_08030 [Leptospira sp. 2 VSF19]|uniref:Lipoprotein n=1 Tax=Leptospira soteropolitanensis TaxID=2950025 RepID=A0AAW5VET6_9LEPT|nr:hypothetical protein [Leptospira soteropolitanensis]MCW7492942.1 hypothetical protein [Leptospira soteropolitanensis]MCW7500177.1 hypothetical protein [Leptospira soteropolitanensis]MCW7522428.1 hypothetical protein [Leptospira soteropolitanensis]MCW7526284.1 hypothetical protein [Leptospira soteropolitanensis]MCW7529604.1 hypothetical protein [Leptospira soteropolitanensis]